MVTSAPGLAESPQVNRGRLSELAGGLKDRRGNDLLSLKPRLLRRRLMVRLRARACGGLSEYLEVLDGDPNEWDALFKALTIQVSGFFRNPRTFEFLERRVLPGLIQRKRESRQKLLILSAGCAEGEEPYSLAMLLDRRFSRESSGVRRRIIGLDMDGDVLARAREAVYGGDRLENMPSGYKNRYFDGRAGGYRLKKEIRESVEFRTYDMTRGLPVTDIDLIICRNVLIYITREFQKRIVREFERNLLPGGYLVLGKTESMVGELRSGFDVVNLAEHIYRKAGDEPCGWKLR